MLILKTEASGISYARSNTKWKSLYRIGGVAALIQVVLIPIQIIKEVRKR